MKFAPALLAIALSTGSVHAMTPHRSHSLSFAHFPTCSEGLVKAMLRTDHAGLGFVVRGDIATPSMVRARSS